MQKESLSIFFILILFISGCSKPERVPLPENVVRLTNGSHKDWGLEKVTYLKINVSSQIPACQRDEIYRFYDDGRGEILSGPTPCKTPEPEVQSSGSWEFTGDGETMIVKWKNDVNWEVSVDELEPNKLVVTGKVFEDYVVTATFKPIK